ELFGEPGKCKQQALLLAKLCLKELGRQIVMVEDKPDTAKLEAQSYEENGVGRVAGLQDAESRADKNLQSEIGLGS
ncbi:MAG: hypothetical protein WB579_16080, partial [Bryobacteraceae bacterium]